MLKLKLQYFGHLMWINDSLKRPWCWERLKEGGEGGDRGWDGWMASPTQLTIIWVNSGSWWWTGRFGVLQFMGSQRVRHNWVSELNWTLKVATIAPTAIVRFISSLYLLRRLNGKDPDSGKDWEHEKKGMTEDRRLNGHEFEQTLVDSEGQGSLAYCSPQSCKELDTTEWLNNNLLNIYWGLGL